MTSPVQLPIFESSEERTAFITENADYFTVTFRRNMKPYRYEFNDLETARLNAQFAANHLGRPVLIYGIICPFSEQSENYGLSTWVENAYPLKVSK
jgi:hypothetical protein